MAIATIVASIIGKSEVSVGADVKKGVSVRIRSAQESLEDFRGDIPLPDLVDLVRKSMD